jgi:ATP-binding cassette, subfamily B, heavy metal transporter
VVDAHTIVVLQHGRIAEQGSHADLLALDGVYARMWHLQQNGRAGAGSAENLPDQSADLLLRQV